MSATCSTQKSDQRFRSNQAREGPTTASQERFPFYVLLVEFQEDERAVRNLFVDKYHPAVLVLLIFADQQHPTAHDTGDLMRLYASCYASPLACVRPEIWGAAECGPSVCAFNVPQSGRPRDGMPRPSRQAGTQHRIRAIAALAVPGPPHGWYGPRWGHRVQIGKSPPSWPPICCLVSSGPASRQPRGRNAPPTLFRVRG